MNDRLKVFVVKEDWGKGVPRVFIHLPITEIERNLNKDICQRKITEVA